MVLLWGLTEDPPMNMVYTELKKMGAPVFFLNHADIGDTELFLNFFDQPSGYIDIYDRKVNLQDIKSAYFRPYDFKQYPEFLGDKTNNETLRKIFLKESLMWSWAELTDKIVINKPSASASNFSKPFQTELIKQFGFQIPETLITTEINSFEKFLQKNKTVIYKSISCTRSIVKKIIINDNIDLSAIENCPVQFQKWIEGINYRVHVVGDNVFTCKILSEGIDYRYSAAIIEPAEIPSTIIANCITLTKELKMELSGIDLLLSTSNDWYCFEVNPSPAFSYYEVHSGLKIARGIAEYLIKTL